MGQRMEREVLLDECGGSNTRVEICFFCFYFFFIITLCMLPPFFWPFLRFLPFF